MARMVSHTDGIREDPYAIISMDEAYEALMTNKAVAIMDF